MHLNCSTRKPELTLSIFVSLVELNRQKFFIRSRCALCFSNMCQCCQYFLISCFKYIFPLKMKLLFVGREGLGILIYLLQELHHCPSCSMPCYLLSSLRTWDFSVCERSKLKEIILARSNCQGHGDLIFASAWVLILFPQYYFILTVNTGESQERGCR